MAAGFMIVASVVLLAALGALVGWIAGAVVPLALVGAAAGLALGFYAVWLRFFKQR